MDNTYHQNLGVRYNCEASSSSKLPLKLILLNQVASPVFTKQNIIGKSVGDDGNKSIKVVLVDGNTGERITSGPEASAKVKVVLIRGDYAGSAKREFVNNIVVDWKRKKNILLGDLFFDLQSGCGTVGEIRIKHDKNSLKNVKFRLGAMVVDCPYEIAEAITDPFEVRDHRNLPKYLRPLSLEDKVGKMIHISHKGTGKIRMRLESKNIRTVRDFLEMHSLNPRGLQEICGIKGKKWITTVNHAKTSLVGNVLVKSCSQQSNTLASDDYDGSIELDNNSYKPQPCEDENSSIPMIEDLNFSTQDLEVCEAYFNVIEPGQGNQEAGMDNGAWALVGNGVEENGAMKLGWENYGCGLGCKQAEPLVTYSRSCR